jgi:hypothetical protein
MFLFFYRHLIFYLTSLCHSLVLYVSIQLFFCYANPPLDNLLKNLSSYIALQGGNKLLVILNTSSLLERSDGGRQTVSYQSFIAIISHKSHQSYKSQFRQPPRTSTKRQSSYYSKYFFAACAVRRVAFLCFIPTLP